jgi:hypothetical protein
MVLTYGTRYVGTIAKTKSGLSIATLFFHIMWIPLVPVSSALVRDGEPVGGMPLSLLSIALGYVRTLLVLAPFIGMMTLPFGLPSLILTVPLCGSLYGLTHLFTRAGREQEHNLERMANDV